MKLYYVLYNKLLYHPPTPFYDLRTFYSLSLRYICTQSKLIYKSDAEDSFLFYANNELAICTSPTWELPENERIVSILKNGHPYGTGILSIEQVDLTNDELHEIKCALTQVYDKQLIEKVFEDCDDNHI